MRLAPRDIERLTDEADQHLRGGIVRKVRDGRSGEICLTIRHRSENHFLLLAIDDHLARIHMVSEAPPRPIKPTSFCQLLRKHLEGAVLREIRHLDEDRVVSLTLDIAYDRDDGGTWRFIAELTGRHGNMFLTHGGDEEGLSDLGIVRGSFRANVSQRRSLIPGKPYERPSRPPQEVRQTRGLIPEDCSPSNWLENHSEAERVELDLEQARRSALKDLRAALKRTKRLIENLQRDIEKAERAPRLQREAELLQSAYGRVQRGAAEVSVVDFYSPEQSTVVITLDPRHDLNGNIQRRFKEAKRLRAGIARTEARMSVAQNQAQRLTEAREALDNAQDIGAVEAVEGQLRAAGLLKQRQQRRTPGEKGLPRSPYREFHSVAGLPIWVGKSAEDNDRLTKLARGRDLWLHIDATSGAHVVIRLEKGQQTDHESLLDAATLAAFYGGTPAGGMADVRFTERKHVRKPKGLPPGRVLTADLKTITVEISQDRLDRLFGAENIAT
ncbi:MAG: NFACT family protein [Myxococcales bacterium]|nr:NFACT family protein [Myxococcales bacterium]